MAKSIFWRLPSHYIGKSSYVAQSVVSLDLIRDRNINKIRRGNGLIVGDLDESQKFAIVSLIGVVKKIDVNNSRLEAHWVNKNLILRPNPSGIVRWRQQESFNFDPKVAKRYLFEPIFAEEFYSIKWSTDFGSFRSSGDSKGSLFNDSDYQPSLLVDLDHSDGFGDDDPFVAINRKSSDMTPDWLKVKRNLFKKSGFVYLVQIKDYFKFQSSSFLPSESPFFKSKSNPKVKILHAAWFADYKFAERDLQSKFYDNRFDGELLYLNDEEIRKVKSMGERIEEIWLKIDQLDLSK